MLPSAKHLYDERTSWYMLLYFVSVSKFYGVKKPWKILSFINKEETRAYSSVHIVAIIRLKSIKTSKVCVSVCLPSVLHVPSPRPCQQWAILLARFSKRNDLCKFRYPMNHFSIKSRFHYLTWMQSWSPSYYINMRSEISRRLRWKACNINPDTLKPGRNLIKGTIKHGSLLKYTSIITGLVVLSMVNKQDIMWLEN